MSLHGIMGINLSENMIINNDAGNAGSEVTNAQVQSNIMGGLEGAEGVKSDERENSLKSKINKKSKIVKKRVTTRLIDETDKKNKKLSINNYESMFSYKYNMIELKKLCLQYKLPRVGNKEELMLRLYNYFEKSIQPIKIQKVFRGYLQRKLIKLQGPAINNRSLCTNEMDFYTMDDMDEIPMNQFYSYKDNDGFLYGFNILSIHNLIMKDGEHPKNPYNRGEFSTKIKEDVKQFIKISRILKIPIEIEIKQEIIDPRKRMELKILELFQLMNSYGNYSNSEWFTNLSRMEHIRFARELCDIWNYRAQLTLTKKIEICPPHGNPFLGTPYFTNVATYINLNNLSNDTVTRFNVQIIENLIKTSIDIDNKSLGALYVLSALTLVCDEARNAMPWLYEAAVHAP